MIEVERKVSKVILTEEGLFHHGQVPGDYTGPQLTIEIAHAVVFSDEYGKLTTFTLYGPPAMSANRAVEPYKSSDMYSVTPPVAEDFGSSGKYQHRYPNFVKTNVDGVKALIESDGVSKVVP